MPFLGPARALNLLDKPKGCKKQRTEPWGETMQKARNSLLTRSEARSISTKLFAGESFAIFLVLNENRSSVYGRALYSE